MCRHIRSHNFNNRFGLTRKICPMEWTLKYRNIVPIDKNSLKLKPNFFYRFYWADIFNFLIKHNIVMSGLGNSWSIPPTPYLTTPYLTKKGKSFVGHLESYSTPIYSIWNISVKK